MASIAVSSPDWWNFKPLCEEIKLKCYQGQWVDINFIKYLIQGANPESERVLMGLDEFLTPSSADNRKYLRDNSQRGFLNTVKTTSDPVHGVFYKNMEYGKIRYIPHSRFTGVDCFRFVLTTPWQSSNEYRVMIDVLPSPSIAVYVHRFLGDNNAFKYSARLLGMPSVVKPHYFVWYESIPTLTTINNRPEIVHVPKIFHEPVTEVVQSKLVIRDSGKITPWVLRYWPDLLVDKKGYLPGTDVLYRYPAGPPSLLVRCVMFDDTSVDVGDIVSYINPLEMWADTLQGGFAWWRTGQYIIWQNSLD